jgi:hypothetical protein
MPVIVVMYRDSGPVWFAGKGSRCQQIDERSLKMRLMQLCSRGQYNFFKILCILLKVDSNIDNHLEISNLC